MIADPHEIQRLRYTPGQDLLSRDFRDQAAFEEQLRWWHNRAMHGAFGVRYGLQARPTGAAEPTVEVDGGLAYDAFGRELILPAPRTARIPAGAEDTGPQVLVIRFREDGGLSSPGDLAGACFCAPAPQGADLAWIPERRLRPADGVPLARTGDVGSLDPGFHPPVARPLARPRLGNGSTVAGGTAWEVWDLGLEQNFFLGLQVSIDTRAAGFTQPPCYFAWLQGGVESRFGDAGPTFLLPFFPQLAEERLTGFRFRVQTFVFGGLENLNQTRNLIVARARLQLSVCWLGIQMRHDEEQIPEVIHGHS